MEVRLFDELEALDGGVPVPVPGSKQGALLVLLALQRGQPVSADRLIDLLRGDGQAERSGRDAAPFRMLRIVVQRLMTTLPWAWPSRMYWMAAGVWLSG
jgi:hypothetical protein